MTTDITFSTVTQLAQKTSASSMRLAQDFDDFLKLLTTQLQNQDPLDPMDTSEFTNQIIQFTQVEQAINQNQKLDDLLALSLANIQSVALGYVGLDISYTSSEFALKEGEPVNITYALSTSAFSASINIYNEKGDLVYSGDVPKNAGAHDFSWDGSLSGGGIAPEGTYSVRIDALNPEGGFIETSTVVTGRVRGIEQQNGLILLLIGERAVPLNAVISATLPEEPAPVIPEEEPA